MKQRSAGLQAQRKAGNLIVRKMIVSLVVTGCLVGSGMRASAQAAAGAKQAAPLQLQKLDDQRAPVDPFPPANPRFFTAPSPSVDTVNSFLRALWGYDVNRIWRVGSIATTPAAGVSKVMVYVAEKGTNAPVQTTSFFVMPDGAHVIADGSNMVSFGATPFAQLRKTLQERADGPARGSASKDLLLVEFSDLQCPHCKEVQGTMDQLVKDFPNARVVYQNFPLIEIHPAAFLAAAYGVCVAKQKNDAFFPYAQAVFDTQAMLTQEDTVKTLQAAVTKAGLNPTTIAACAETQPTKDEVNASIKLAGDAGVNQTPMLAVNGHLIPLGNLPYETLKQIITFQAQLDGVQTGASASTGTPDLKMRPSPSTNR